MQRRRVAWAANYITLTLTLTLHLYSPERQQQQVKEAPNTQQQKQTNKREENYGQIGRTGEQCYHIYTPTNSKNIC